MDWPENQPGPAELTHVQSIYERNHLSARYEIVKGDQGMCEGWSQGQARWAQVGGGLLGPLGKGSWGHGILHVGLPRGVPSGDPGSARVPRVPIYPTITPIHVSGKFRMEPETGVVYVLDRLDRENQSMYIMVIRARPVTNRPKRQSGDLLSSKYLELWVWLRVVITSYHLFRRLSTGV